MRFESRTWFLLSLLFLAGAVYFWLRGNEYESRKRLLSPSRKQTPATNRPPVSLVPRTSPFKLLSQIDPAHSGAGPRLGAGGNGANPAPQGPGTTAGATNHFPHRLTNTTKPIQELARQDGAILMRNAFIDTTEGTNLAIPEGLRADRDPGSYVVQARGAIQASFRQRLQQAGASIVSYIPNNAYLVQVSADGANQLGGLPEVQAVLPYEPYYKLDSQLLGLVLDQKQLADGQWLRVTAFPGQGDTAATAVTALGGTVLQNERTPFGPQMLVRPAPNSLSAIAKLASVQIIESFRPRALLNDLTRVQIGLAAAGTDLTNYLDLTGSNVMVNVSDSGVDSTHPDLAGRVLADTPLVLQDLVGHGTHVAGIIAGDGSQSSSVKSPPPGSDTNANFRGMAPAATIFTLPFQAFPEVSFTLQDTYLQETAASTNVTVSSRPNGPMVSNNSWGYTGITEYDSSAASYDAAVRDALPGMAGEQSMIYVFAAGNSGNGDDGGMGGDPNTIPSPANAKNVIAVGAIEHLRNIANTGIATNSDGSVTTNTPFLGLTDSNDEVASFSSRGNVGIGTEGQFGRFKPDLVAPGTFIVSTRSKDWKLENDIDTNSPEGQVLEQVNAPLAPYYRFETGTSQAAPVVSGMLALMQEFFEQRLPGTLRRTNSPALMKALLINGARSLGPAYDLQVQNSINYQGWGLVNISNSLPVMMLTQPENAWPIRVFDQSPTNALATGESRSWNVTLSTNSQDTPFRVTLVWTDPPGNPAAAIKLVNDLDLVVSNTVTGDVYYGNNIGQASDFTQASSTNQPPVFDNVNNVENVYIQDPGSTNLVITVSARRVNVNAVPNDNALTGRIDDVVQDFALVVSTDDQTITNAFSITPATTVAPLTQVQPTPMTNGVAILNQRAGANSSLFNSRNGVTNQWDFFVFTNLFVTNDISTMTNGTNVAFVTFLPPDLGRPRLAEADLDLYVSKDPGLLKLDPAVVDAAWKSVSRGGTESIVFTNAALGDVFYIGVKSEDQQGGEYGLIGLSTDAPFESNQNGSTTLHGMPVPQGIPDGSPAVPGRATVMAIAISPITVKRVVASVGITHQNVGDLTMALSHNQTTAVLHNHTLNNGFPNVTNAVFIYDDQAFGVRGAGNPRHSDGPGSLNSFAGQSSSGVWFLNVVDNAPGQTGLVNSLTIQLDPFLNQDLGSAGAAGISGTVGPNDAACYYIDVPPQATNLIVSVSQMSGPLEVLIEHGSMPTTNSFSKSADLTPPGGTVTIGANDQPFPLEAGRYFVCLYNSSDATVDFHVTTQLQFGVGMDYQRTLIATNAIPLIDDGVITSTITMPVDKEVADVQVKVRIDSPRSSDLVLHLTSPQGTRVLLAENRGGPSSTGYGTGSGSNITYTIFTEDTNLIANLQPIKFSLPPWTNLNSSTNLPIFADSFETAIPGTYTNGQSFTGWAVNQGQVIVHNPGSAINAQAQTGTNFVELDTHSGPSAMSTSFPTTPGKDYVLSFYYQRNPAAPFGTPHNLQVYVGPPTNSPAPTATVDVRDFGWSSTNVLFRATGSTTELQFGATNTLGPLLDTVMVADAVPATNIYVLPEESLAAFQGERALGDWTLEVWDNRAGPPGDPGALIDWQLQIEYGNPSGFATVLTNGVPFSGVISTNQTNYFVMDICASASVAFANLSGPLDHLNLLVNREGIPLGSESDDFAPLPNDLPVDNQTGFASIAITKDPHYPAPLEPGQRLFFAVHNLNPNETNAFTIQVSLDNDTCTQQRPIIVLTNNVPYTNVVAPSGLLFDYYVFNVTPTAIRAEFEATPQNGDIGMVLRYGLPLPNLLTNDYKSDRPGITNELIILTNTSTPVALTPGNWYIGVYNNSTNSVAYDIRASEVLDTNYNLIFLTNAVPFNFTIGQGARLTNFFVFQVMHPAPGLQFDLSNLTANADLLIATNRLPSYTNFFMSNSASPSQPLSLQIKTNAALPDLTSDWVLEVINKGASNLSFAITASLLGGTNSVPETNRVFDPDISVTSTNICFSWDATVGLQYQLEGKRSITDPTWDVLLGPFVATNTVVNYCMSLPTDYHFFQVVESGGAPPPPTQNIITPDLTVTTNNICLSWASTIGFTYQVQAKTNITDVSWSDLTSPVVATNTTMSYCVSRPTPFHYFQILESSGSTNPPPTTGTIITPALNVSTNGICLSWPSEIGTNYIVQAMLTVTDTSWTNLTTITASATNSTYCLPNTTPYHFFQIVAVTGSTNPPPPTTGAIITPALTVSTNGICLDWASEIGTNYIVQAMRTITDTGWTNLTTVTATSTNSSYCLPKTTPYHFFQIVAVGGSTNPPPPTTGTLINPAVEVSTNGVCLLWASEIGTNYIVQAMRAVTDPSWTNLTSITATTTNSSYCLPKTTPYHFFQIVAKGAASSGPPATNSPVINPALELSTNRLCFSWSSEIGAIYLVEGKRTIVDATWTNLSANITATSTNTTFCLNRPTPFQFFQVRTISGGSAGAGSSTNQVTLHTPIVLVNGKLQLTWDSTPGASYELDVATNLVPVIHWTVVTNVTATATSVTVTDSRSITNGPMRFYRIVQP